MLGPDLASKTNTPDPPYTQAFLDSVAGGVLVSMEAVAAVPHTLMALCLNSGGLKLVKESKALRCLVPIFSSKQYVKALQGETLPLVSPSLWLVAVRHAVPYGWYCWKPHEPGEPASKWLGAVRVTAGRAEAAAPAHGSRLRQIGVGSHVYEYPASCIKGSNLSLSFA